MNATVMIRLDEIEIGDRSRTEARNVQSLARSIREHSLIQPPVVRRVAGRYVLVCGLRRLAAIRSLGWSQTPAVLAESIADEVAALYAEGDENTEREPFTPAEAVAHRRRIREAEARAAKERQRASAARTAASRPRDEAGRLTPMPVSSKLEQPGPVEPQAESRTRHRTAKATGYGATTLDKAEKVLNAAEDETQPEPVRQVARQAAENLTMHGAKVDREYKAVERVIAEHSDQAQAYRDAQWRKQLVTELGKLGDLKTFDPERVVAICDDDQLFLIDSVCEGVAAWYAEVRRLRQPGLRVVQGGAR